VASNERAVIRASGVPRLSQLGRVVVAALTIALVIGACGSSPTGSTAQKTYKIVFHNDYIGNQWRVQMVNDIKHRATTKYGNNVKFSYVQGQFDLTAQIGDLQQIILSKPDAIVMEAHSATGLNPTLKQACKAGILVYTFDQTATEPCAYQLVLSNWVNQSYDMAQWMCKVTGGNGTLLQDIGSAGSPLGDAFVKGWGDYLKSSCPGLSIVANYASGAAEGPGTQALSNLLSQYPHVVGIFGDGYCSSGITVMQKLGLKVIPQTCFYTNASAISCVQAGAACFYWSAPPWIGITALDNVVQILGGGTSPKIAYASDTNYFSGQDVTSQLQLKQKLQVLKVGVDYFPSLSPDLALPVTDSDYGITPQIALGQ
jgi:ribose transport system substrate-binding protein